MRDLFLLNSYELINLQFPGFLGRVGPDELKRLEDLFGDGVRGGEMSTLEIKKENKKQFTTIFCLCLSLECVADHD